jgi:hypothetical protein
MYYLRPKMHPQLGTQLAPLRIKKNGAAEGIELTPSPKHPKCIHN